MKYFIKKVNCIALSKDMYIGQFFTTLLYSYYVSSRVFFILLFLGNWFFLLLYFLPMNKIR